VREAETRGPLQRPRTCDASGIPLHFDGQLVFKERIFRHQADPKLIHHEITVSNHALTRPWTIDKKYTSIQFRHAGAGGHILRGYYVGAGPPS
jgi:hypothetical protein